ncbi:predicted protein [Uncinocarpus reesii 1704]|uniref:Large ribosomal subunit protein mL50 n=1 Tax=Uncinocarpus reesii (strain UAMH 1704) TaxID=336963 RepID=C4JJ20_UNCRE|nr:uncharacterized protein UREG_01627 [Uncinocarpus reesii 1704]EEP76778.1 predicted protein [Uncinocarpus reesii 1704]
MKELNRPLEDVCNIWEYDEQVLALMNRVEVKSSNHLGMDALVFPSEVEKTALLEFFRDIDFDETTTVDETPIDESEASGVSPGPTETSALSQLDITDLEIRTPENLEFLAMPLTDPTFQFAFLKRASQLTGYRVPDPEISSVTEISSLLKLFTAASKPKPAKLADILIAEGKFAALPNVKIFDRRQTPIDQEKEVGRWKIIEEELTKRGLPVTGRVKT